MTPCQIDMFISTCIVLPATIAVFLYSRTVTLRLKRLIYEQQLKINHHVAMYDGLSKMYEGVAVELCEHKTTIAIYEAKQNKEFSGKATLSDDDIDRITARAKQYCTTISDTNTQLREALEDYPKGFIAKRTLKKVLSKFQKT